MDDWAKAKAITGQRAVADVAKEWARSLPPASPMVSKAVEEYLEAKDAAKRSTRHVRDLRERLGRFAEAFRCQISTVSTSTVEMWLQSLPVGPRSRRNYLGAITGLLRFAERRGYVARGSIDLSGVERADAGTEIAIYSPAELRTLLAGMRHDLIPFVALGAFAGLRTAEIQRLDWREIGAEWIEVKAAKAKTRSRRLVPILLPLTKWLEPHRKEEGPVCPLAEPAHVLGPLSRKLGVPWKPNGLRHSFGSYRLAQTRNEGQVALEMGNSPAMIFRHYRALVTEAQAAEWFAIAPK